MQFKILINYILGFVDIIVEGYYIERFINICANKNIFLWHLRRENSVILRARVSIKNFKSLKNICKKTSCKMKIEKKNGIPFIVNHYKKRKIFIGLLILVILVIITTSNFVWNIEITGNNTIQNDEIEQILKECDIKIGKFKGKINMKEAINELRLKRDDIAWVGIDIKGTNLIVKIVEAQKKPEIIDESEYCNIVANKDCMIMKINAINGTPLVKEGEIITKGTPIIGGWMEGKYTGIRYVHAQGEINAKVWYTNKQKIYLKEIKKEQTGFREEKYSISLNDLKINFYKTLSKFENYDTIEENKKIKIFSNFYLPITIIKYTNNEYRNIEIVHDVEEAKNIGIERAKVELEQYIQDENVKLLNNKINTKQNLEYVEVELIYEVQENIGTKEKIVF